MSSYDPEPKTSPAPAIRRSGPAVSRRPLPARVGTIVWGLVVLALAALIIISQLGIVVLNGTYVLIGLMIGAGAALVIGGLLSARGRDNELNKREVLNHGKILQHCQGPWPEARSGALAGRRVRRNRRRN